MAEHTSFARYMRDNWMIRLGNLASTLAKVSTRAPDTRFDDLVRDWLRESALFIEWNAVDTPLEQQLEFAKMQRELGLWHLAWPTENVRDILALRTHNMSERVLELSGLLEAHDGKSSS